ncbi:MAG: RNA polymerase sigma factor [Alphaproteobacteria bacterium]
MAANLRLNNIGRDATFTRLVRAHQGAIRAFLRRLTRNHALADDLAQVTFLKAYEKQSLLRDDKTAKAWLFQIAYRTFLDEYRKTTRRNALTEHPIDEPVPEAQPGLASDIEKAMNRLPEECRAVVILCLSHGLSHSEAARVTNLPIGTVKSHVSRGKSKLRAFLFAYETSQ